jgi:hypothetical protein
LRYWVGSWGWPDEQLVDDLQNAHDASLPTSGKKPTKDELNNSHS